MQLVSSIENKLSRRYFVVRSTTSVDVGEKAPTFQILNQCDDAVREGIRSTFGQVHAFWLEVSLFGDRSYYAANTHFCFLFFILIT